MKTLAAILLMMGLGASSLADITLKLTDATITLNGQGRVTSLRFADGTERAPAASPSAFSVTTGEGVFQPSAVSRKGSQLTVTFGDQGHARFEIIEGRGFAVLKLAELAKRNGMA